MAWNDNPVIIGDLIIQMDVKDAEGILRRLEERDLMGKVHGTLSNIDLAAKRYISDIKVLIHDS